MGKRKKKKISKKKIIIISSIIIAIILTLVYFFCFDKKTMSKVFTYKNKLTIEAGSKVPTENDFLYEVLDEEKEIVWNNLDIDEGKAYKPGTYTGKFNYKGEEKEVMLVIKDTTSPNIEGVKDIEVLAYTTKPNLSENIKVTDNSREEIEPKLEGTFDIEKVGEYNLTFTATDSSGNKTSKEFKVTVKENKDIKVTKSKKGYTIKNYHGVTYIGDVVIANKTYSLPEKFAPQNLVGLGNIKIVDYVKDAFTSLSSDASSIGLNIYASSGYRSYRNQEYIYNNYVSRDGKENADTYSARPGYSEHQTGLAIDVNTVDMSFDNTSESKWLSENCYKYGFTIRYPKGKDSITGYMYEPWHIRYVGKKLAGELYNNGNWLTLEEYYGIDSKY